jgi:DNA-binding CsgD family transcriptional regulator
MRQSQEIPDLGPVPRLIGRTGDCAHIDRLLQDAQSGSSAALVLRGAPGAGKTALLDYAEQRAGTCRVIRAAGVESEMELPFAGLHQLCAPLLDLLAQLPVPQRGALAAAFGLEVGDRPDRFLISLALLSLLADAAHDRPVLCLVDDAQWLDRASALALGFVARRLGNESILLIFAVRDPVGSDDLVGLPSLNVEGLSDEHARELLGSVIGAPLDEHVRARILDEARGNPLALLELPREAPLLSMADGIDFLSEMPVQSRIEESFRRRVRELPAATQQVLLLAAAEPTGAPGLLWRAAVEAGVSMDAVAPAVGSGLVELGARIVFCHPLLRSAIYQGATAEDRRGAHRALAAGTDAEVDPDRRAWHLARAALAPDEGIAAELERSAGRAQARGGMAAAASFLQGAAALTLDAQTLVRRSLEAAAAKQLAGAPEEALALLSTASEASLDALAQAKLVELRGQIALDLRRAGSAVRLLLEAARRLEDLDADRAREVYLEAFRAASVAGRLGGDIAVAADAARTAPRRAGASNGVDLLLEGLAIRYTDGYAASVPVLDRAVAAVPAAGDAPGQSVRWPWIARRIAPDLFDEDAWHELAVRNVQIARATGSLAVLPLALNYLSLLRCFEGRLDTAEILVEEADQIAAAIGIEPISFGRTLIAGCAGDPTVGLPLIASGDEFARAREEGVGLTFGEHARALLHNGLGEHEQALRPAQSASARDELMVSTWALSELIEAAARSGATDAAAQATELLAARAQVAGRNLGLGLAARAQALISGPGDAERHHLEAVQRLGRSRLMLEFGRARLLYGEWLRREQRRSDARGELRAAHEMFATMGAQAFAARARRELLAAGASVSDQVYAAGERLTAQEAQIAQFARDGLSNPEIAARLFISPRTVQYHLRKVFLKLDISSRGQLHRVLPTDLTMV